MSALAPPDDLTEAASLLEGEHPATVVRWAFDRFGGGLVTTASFEDAVLVHLAATEAPGTDVVLLDTQYLFAETWWFAERVTRRLGIPLRVERPAAGVEPDDRWEHDVEGCCGVRKVEPLARALEGRTAWLTGIRRVDGPTRAATPVIQWDERRNLVKVNPLVSLSDDDLALYETLHDLPRHPLKDKGYPSIGCWPCTRPVAPGEDKRAGRWSGQTKTECGLHA
jgi:phosphoadenosine phosphosulfate reductase